ncbi:hypothetical protein GXB84_07960 [Stenotrophomonas acidaminiphila]|uniref:hypothetical protein n=1 Tax=Stenotrophomonas acidaminiphila TaxID=128780 RepID=UPI0013755BC2|nr:hypothetical protein [Stenotrophomonas acidaminiphila]NCT87260.1 hypothetical protein [Stenotrophomonas acidaminiphila]
MRGKVGALEASAVSVVSGEGSSVADVCEVVVRDLAMAPAQPDMSGVRAVTPLPPPLYGNPEIQPLRGAAAYAPEAGEP